MGESELLQALILGFIAIVTTSAMAGGAAAYTFKAMAKTAGDSIDRWMKTAEERDNEAKAKTAEMEARAELNIKLSEAIHETSKVRNELTVVSKNAQEMDEAVRQMGIRVTAIEDEKKLVENERDLLKAENVGLKADNARLEDQIKDLQAQVNELKEKVNHLESQNRPETPPDVIEHNPTLVLTAPESAIVQQPEGNDPL